MKIHHAVLMLSAVAALLAGCDNRQSKNEAATPSTSVGKEIDDSVITAKVKSALMADSTIKSFDFKVETHKGEVLLSGFVDSPAQVYTATEIARAVEGVTSVKNNVTLKEGSATVGDKIDDSIITTKVKSALLANPNIKSSDISVVTHKGEVQLSGFANDQAQIDRAIATARSVEGVSNVVNKVAIKK
ncbi:MAG: BON domain-containing protein [Gallionellaceae bacterium]|nr:BON domain-containing protein [Gallionellaceae bacterium]